VSGAAIFGRELRLGRWRLVGKRVHVSMMVTAMAGITPTLLRWPFTL
jgi:hypothetical protein